MTSSPKTLGIGDPEDLTTLDPTKAGVAFLSREVLLGKGVQIRLRRQPLQLASYTWLMAVVRIETASDFTPNDDMISETAQGIAAVAQQPNVRAVQVDFDATASQRAFYAAVLHQLRTQLAPGMPFSITALVHWCGDNSWLHSLPIDEAVPMFFRMGGPAAAVTYHRLRLMPRDSAAREQLLAVLPAIRAHGDTSTLNQFIALNAASAPTLEAWLATTGRIPASESSYIEQGDDLMELFRTESCWKYPNGREIRRTTLVSCWSFLRPMWIGE